MHIYIYIQYILGMQLIFIISLDKILRITKNRTENSVGLKSYVAIIFYILPRTTFGVYFMVFFKNNFTIISQRKRRFQNV